MTPVVKLTSLLGLLAATVAPPDPPDPSILISVTRHSEYEAGPGYCEHGPHIERQVTVFPTGEVHLVPSPYPHTQCHSLRATDLEPLLSMLRGTAALTMHPDFGVTTWNQPYEKSLQITVPNLLFWGFVKRPITSSSVTRLIAEIDRIASLAWEDPVSVTND